MRFDLKKEHTTKHGDDVYLSIYSIYIYLYLYIISFCSRWMLFARIFSLMRFDLKIERK